MKNIHSLRISPSHRSIRVRLDANWNRVLGSMKPVATVALFSLAMAEADGAFSISQQPGLWSAATTWDQGAVPDGSGSVLVFHPVILDIDSGPSTGALFLRSGSLLLNPGVTLTVPDAGVLVFEGTTISGPGRIDGAPFLPLALLGGTVTSSFDVGEIDVYTGTTGTVRQGTAISLFLEPSNTLRIVQEPGQTDGLTLDGNLYFQFNDGTATIDLGFDPGSSLYDWAFRWKGDRDEYLTGLLGTQLTFSGTVGVDIFYDASDDYTYVVASNTPEPSVLGLIGASGMFLLRRRR